MSERLDVRIPSGDGELAAWVYPPSGGEGESPCVVLVHGLTATREERLWAFAERFAAAGFCALAFDYRHLGDSSGEPRQLIDLRRQYEDWDAAIAYAATIDGVDPRRIAIWGASFSGGHVIDAAARHDRLAAAISLVPLTDARYESLRSPLGRNLRLLGEALRDRAGSLRGAEPRHVPVVAPTGGLAMISDDDSWEGVRAIVGERSRWRNELAARLILHLPNHRPARNAHRVACPLLIQIAEFETVVHNAPAIGAADRAPRGELRRYPSLRHFDVYTGRGFEQVIEDQLQFLRRHLDANG